MNLPNLLTIARLILIPIYLYYFFYVEQGGYKYAFIIFIVSGLTDILDGYIARKYNLITKLGTVLDPLADKLMSLCVMISLTAKHDIPMLIITIAVLKECIMIIGAIVLYKTNNTVITANGLGKLSTFSFYLSVFLFFLGIDSAIFLLYFYICLTIMALIKYLMNFMEIIKYQKLDITKK